MIKELETEKDKLTGDLNSLKKKLTSTQKENEKMQKQLQSITLTTNKNDTFFSNY
jgi:DNA-binding protein YbaB